MNRSKLKNALLVIVLWLALLTASIILNILRPVPMPSTIVDNLWVLPVCLIPILTVLLEDYLSRGDG